MVYNKDYLYLRLFLLKYILRSLEKVLINEEKRLTASKP